MKIAICDDVSNDAYNLQTIVASHLQITSSAIEIYSSGLQLLNKLGNNIEYDIIFLDVDMPDINGIDLGKKIRNFSQNTYIVFVTNYPEYALKAYDCNAFHYLIKPLNRDKITEVLNVLVQIYQKNHSKYTVKTKSGFINIPINDLYYVEYCRKHIIFHMESSTIEVPGKLTDVYNSLKNFDFCQVHQGYIVNMRKIINLDKLNAYLENGDIVPISHRKRADVLISYTDYLGENY